MTIEQAGDGGSTRPSVRVEANPSDPEWVVDVTWTVGDLAGDRLVRYATAMYWTAQQDLVALHVREDGAMPPDSRLSFGEGDGSWVGCPRSLLPEVVAVLSLAQQRALGIADRS